MAQIKITLSKSPIGRKPEQRKTVAALGLGKLNSSVVKEDNAAIRGRVTLRLKLNFMYRRVSNQATLLD